MRSPSRSKRPLMRASDDTPIETPIPRKARRYDYLCSAHGQMETRVAVIEANTTAILATVDRIEKRVYDNAGETRMLYGAGKGSSQAAALGLKILAVVIAAGAGVGTLVGAVVAIAKLVE
jgi:hypothetical protein